MKNKTYYPWIICAGGILVMFCSSGLAFGAYAVYQPYLISQAGLTNAQASSFIMIRSIFAMLGSAMMGAFYKKFSYRTGLAFNVLLIGAGFFIYSIARNYLMFAAGAAIMGVGHTLGGMVPVAVLISRWFKVRRTFATALCAAGSGLATIIAPPIVTLLIEQGSLSRAAFTEAAGIAVIAVVVFLLLKDMPDDTKGLVPLTGVETGPQKKAAEFGKEAKASLIAMAVLSYILVGAPGNSGYSHLSVLYTTNGIDEFRVSGLISLLGVMVMCSKIAFGWMTDKFGGFKSCTICYFFLTAGTLICCFAGSGSYALAALSIVLIGLGIPLTTVGTSVIATGISDEAHYQRNMNFLNMAYMAGAAIFASVPGIIADHTGSYIFAYMAFTVFSALAMLLALTAYAGNRA